jgi:hypothetical protein
MGQPREQRFRRLATLAIVFGGHILLVLLIASHRTEIRKQSSTLNHTVLVLLDEELPRERPLPKQVPERTPPANESRARREQPLDQPVDAGASSTSVAVPAAPEGIPQIDWHREAQITTNAMAPQLIKKQQRKCDEAKRTGAARPTGCKKDSYEAEWKPEPGRFGVSGGIPYVRLGKRCVLGLGFFGCALGKLPDEDMDDPDRPRSSVPDIPTGNGLAELPTPEVIKHE